VPLYSYACPRCYSEETAFRKIDDRNNGPVCCGVAMHRLLDAPMVGAMGLSDHAAVVSPIDGRTLYGKSEYLKHCKEHGVVPASDMQGEAQHQQKQRAAEQKVQRREQLRQIFAQTT